MCPWFNSRWHHLQREDADLPFFVMKHFVYIIYSQSADKFYVGESVNPYERLNQHNSGFYKGASTKIASDWEIFHLIQCESKTQALQIEKFIKMMKSRRFYLKLKTYEKVNEDLLLRFSK